MFTCHEFKKGNKCVELFVVSKEGAVHGLLLFLFSYLPTMHSLPEGRLIKTNAIVGYHCNTGAQRTAGSYFSFSLVWWCDFVFFRNRFVSNGSVYLSSLSPFSLLPLCKGKDGVLWAVLSHYLESADLRAAPNRTNFTDTLGIFSTLVMCSTDQNTHLKSCLLEESIVNFEPTLYSTLLEV